MTDETWVTRAAKANLNRKVNEIVGFPPMRCRCRSRRLSDA